MEKIKISCIGIGGISRFIGYGPATTSRWKYMARKARWFTHLIRMAMALTRLKYVSIRLVQRLGNLPRSISHPAIMLTKCNVLRTFSMTGATA